MKNQFDETYFNESEYLIRKDELEALADKVTVCISALRAEGLPINPEFISEITTDDLSFRNYVRNLADKKIGKEFLPLDEKSRIYDSYNQLLNRNNDYVQSMRKAIETGRLQLVFEKNSVKVNYDSIEAEARAAATHTVDAESMKNYFDEVGRAVSAINGLREYESKHGLPDFVNGGLFYTTPATVKGFKDRIKLLDFVEKGGGETLFAEIARETFFK